MEVARVLGRELAAPCDVQRGDGVVTSVRVLIVDVTLVALTLILCGGAGPGATVSRTSGQPSISTWTRSDGPEPIRLGQHPPD